MVSLNFGILQSPNHRSLSCTITLLFGLILLASHSQLYFHVVIKIQFASTKFTGSESSGEMSVSIVVLEAVSSSDINVMIKLNEGTAKG